MNASLERAFELWASGGWAMIPLALNALILYGKAAGVHLTLRRHIGVVKRYQRQLRKVPRAQRGEVEYGAAVSYLSEHGVEMDRADSIAAVGQRFDELRSIELPPIERDLRFLKVAMASAPLLGLLGTVTGMLSTFAALSAGSGGGKTMDKVAGGISEALITTQTGLMIALPGYFIFYVLTRHRDRFTAFIAHLETVCTQHLHREDRPARRRVAAPARKPVLVLA